MTARLPHDHAPPSAAVSQPRHPRLSDGRPVRWVPSPNHDARKDIAAPDMIVLHYTDMTSAEAAVARLCDPAARVSAHYLVTMDGEVVQMVAEERRAWHAGVSTWFGLDDLNSRSIGIELDSPGHRPTAPTFPDAQIEALLVLLADLRGRWPVPVWNVVAHSDIAPTRKIDPGEAFPWHRLAAAGHALVPGRELPPGPAPADLLAALAEALTECGYVFPDGADPGPIVEAFHRRCLPSHVGREADVRSLAAARALRAATRAAMDAAEPAGRRV